MSLSSFIEERLAAEKEVTVLSKDPVEEFFGRLFFKRGLVTACTCSFTIGFWIASSFELTLLLKRGLKIVAISSLSEL